MTKNIKKLVILNIPYVLVGLVCTNLGEAWRIAQGSNASEKVQSLIRLISSGYIKTSGITGAFFFGEQKCSIRRTQQPVGAGDHIKLIV